MYTTSHPLVARECSQLAGIPPHCRDNGCRGGCKCCSRVFLRHQHASAHEKLERSLLTAQAGRRRVIQAPHAAWQEVPRDRGYWFLFHGAENPSRKDRKAAAGALQLKRERTELKPAQLRGRPAKDCEGNKGRHRGASRGHKS